MAFLTAQQISHLAVQLLSRRLVLPMTVSRVPGDEFRGHNGDTVTIRVPVSRTANVQSTPGAEITSAGIDEDEAEVSVVQVYDAAPVTDHEMTLEIVSFGRQVLLPMTDAVARGAEDQLADTLNDISPEEAFNASASHENTKDLILHAREELTKADVPPDDRFFSVSPEIATRVIDHPDFSAVHRSGSDQTLRRGVIGTLYGFTFVESNGLASGTAHAYHESAFGFATFPTVEMDGTAAVQSSVTTEQGISLRVLRQWNPHRLQQEVVVTAFAGAGIVDLDRAVSFETETGA